MSAPTFVELDDTTFEDTTDGGVPMSTAALKKTGENIWWCVNERLPPVGISYTSWSGGSAVRQPTFSTVRWASFCLGQIFVPAVLQTGQLRQVRVPLRMRVSGYNVRYCVWSAEATGQMNAAQLDSLTNDVGQTAFSGQLEPDAADQEFSVDVQVAPGRWNTLWIATRSHYEMTPKLSTETTGTFRFVQGFWRIETGTDFSGEWSANDVPNNFFTLADAGTTDEDLEMMPYTKLFTVGYADTDGTDWRFFGAEFSGGDVSLFARQYTYGFQTLYGELGVAVLKSVFVDQTQANDLTDGHINQFAELRAYQPPGSTRFRRLFNLTDALYSGTMFNLAMGQDAIDLTKQDYPGVWQLNGAGYVTGNTSATLADAQFLTPAEFTWQAFVVWDATFRAGSAPGLELSFLYAASLSTFDRPIRMLATLDIVDLATSTSIAEGEQAFEFMHAAPVQGAGNFGAAEATTPYSGGRLGYTFRAVAVQRSDTYLGADSYGATSDSRWSHDGLTLVEDVGQWTRVTVRVPAVDMVAGDAYTVRLKLEQLPTQIDGLDVYGFGIFATTGHGLRVVPSVTQS